jgi:DNA-directed RNA polymerase subunit N (RpoN/RPB10)
MSRICPKVSIIMSKADTPGKAIANKCREYVRKVSIIMSKTEALDSNSVTYLCSKAGLLKL